MQQPVLEERRDIGIFPRPGDVVYRGTHEYLKDRVLRGDIPPASTRIPNGGEWAVVGVRDMVLGYDPPTLRQPTGINHIRPSWAMFLRLYTPPSVEVRRLTLVCVPSCLVNVRDPEYYPPMIDEYVMTNIRDYLLPEGQRSQYLMFNEADEAVIQAHVRENILRGRYPGKSAQFTAPRLTVEFLYDSTGVLVPGRNEDPTLAAPP